VVLRPFTTAYWASEHGLALCTLSPLLQLTTVACCSWTPAGWVGQVANLTNTSQQYTQTRVVIEQLSAQLQELHLLSTAHQQQQEGECSTTWCKNSKECDAHSSS